MADRSVNLRLGVDISGLTSRLTAAKSSVNDFAKTADKRFRDNSASLDTMSNSAGVAGAALLGMAGLAVKRFADFDKAMSSVKASTRATGAELESLRAVAVKAGADTAFSAEEAAAGIDELAKAGVATKDILGGGLAGALNLAAAGQISVAEAAETAASAMVQFGLKGSDVGHVADLLAAGAGKAQGSVSDMGAALNQAGLIAASTGLSVEETTGSLAAMASAGLLGSDAGTSLKTSLVALSAPSAVAAKEMKRLGISAYDANGEFVGMEALAGNLQTALGHLTPAQRNAAMATIFGTDALRTANVLYEQGAAGISEWTAKVNDSGYAAETARIQTDNLTGDLERLGGAFDTALIQSGSGANDVLRDMVQGAEGVVDAIGRLPAPVLSATGLIAGAGGLALLGVAGLGKLTVGFHEAKTAAAALGISTKAAGLAAGGLGVAIGAGAIAFTLWAQEAAAAKARTDEYLTSLDELGRRTEATTEQISTALSGDTISSAVDGARSYIDIADEMGIATEDLTGYILGEQDARDRVTEATKRYRKEESFVGSLLQERNTQVGDLVRGLDSEADSLTNAEKAAAQKARADEARGVATEDATTATQDATAALADNTEAIEENWKATLDAANGILGLRDANRGLEQAIDDAREAIDDNGKTLNANTEKGRANQAALDGIAEAGWRAVDAAREQGASSSELTGIMAKTRDEFIKGARAAGLSKAAANALADELRLIPRNVTTKVDVNTAGALSAINDINNTLNSINGKTVTASVVIKRYGQAALATGGPVSGPGSGTSDSVPAMLSNGEHVLTAEEVRKAGGHGAIYALRQAMRAGVQHLASGGEVGAARTDVLRKRRAVEAARSAWRRSRTDRNEDRLERARDAADEARERYGRLLEEQSSVRTQLRRGEIRSGVSGGLSGALGVTDQLRDLANSGDVGGRRSRILKNAANDAEKALKGLYAQAERIDRRLERATDRLEKWQGIADGVSSSISGAFSLGEVSGGVDQWSGQERQATGQQMLAASLEYQGKARALVVKMRALQDAGYGTAILQEVAAQGVEGGVAMADALLGLSPKERKALQASQAAIDFYAGRAGVVATDGNLTDAQRDVRTAEAQAAAIDRRINGWGKRLGRELALALGIKARASGGPTMAGGAYLVGEQGPELHVPRSSGYVVNSNKTANMLGGGANVSVTVNQYNPVTPPVSTVMNTALGAVAAIGL